MSTELVIPSIDMVPESLQDDRYYVGNQHFVTKQVELAKEIEEQQSLLKAWEVKACKLYSEGKSVRSICQELKKSHKDVNASVNSGNGAHLVRLHQSLDLYMDGPNECVRKQMLWEIAVDNKTVDPKETIKAIQEMNKMSNIAKGQGGFGGQINIVISNQMFKRGDLDG